MRVSVYRTLELWVQVAGACGGILQGSPGHSELLFTHLLSDITPGAESVKVGSTRSPDMHLHVLEFSCITMLEKRLLNTEGSECTQHGFSV